MPKRKSESADAATTNPKPRKMKKGQRLTIDEYRYYNSNASGHSSTASKTALNKVFDKYRNPKDADNLGIEEIMPYFDAIGADLAGLSSLVAQEIMRCPEMGSVTREGFLDGWASTNCETVDKQKKFLAERTKTLGQPAQRQTFKAVYKHSFEICLQGANVRLVPKDTLVEMWRILFSPPGFDWKTSGNDWLGMWIEFVEQCSAKAFNRDVWMQTLRFAEETLKDESLGFWSEESSWPSVIDEFVEWVKEKKGISGSDKNVDEDEDMEY